MKRCVWCRSQIPDDEATCRYCLTPQQTGSSYKPGDRIRIRNVYKGTHVENVTVIAVYREGSAIEVQDEAGRIWGYIHPRDVLGPALTDRERTA